MEVVMGLRYDATDFHPMSAMIWSTIANARRMMRKSPQILQETKDLCKLREQRVENEYQSQKKRKIEAPTSRASRSVPQHTTEACSGSGAGVGSEPDLSRPLGGWVVSTCHAKGIRWPAVRSVSGVRCLRDNGLTGEVCRTLSA